MTSSVDVKLIDLFELTCCDECLCIFRESHKHLNVSGTMHLFTNNKLLLDTSNNKLSEAIFNVTGTTLVVLPNQKAALIEFSRKTKDSYIDHELQPLQICSSFLPPLSTTAVFTAVCILLLARWLVVSAYKREKLGWASSD